MVYGNYSNNPWAVQYQPQVIQQPQPMANPQPVQQPVQMPTQQPNNSIIWVQGEAGAKSYLIAPGNSLLLMDSEGDYFYIKSADGAGMPSLRKFEYTEVGANTQIAQKESAQTFNVPNLDKYVTRDEMRAEIEKLVQSMEAKKTKRTVDKDGEQSV